jgi:UDP-N-acetylmuramoylalanine--D-glutamate ligase
VGITGTRGKSMTTALIYHVLKDNIKNHSVYLGGNMRGVSTLPLIKKVEEGDVLVCELDSWQLQGFGDSKMSPNFSVFTTFMPDHMNYYKNSMEKYFADKANIYRYQKKGDILVVSKEMKRIIKEKLDGKVVIADKDEVSNYKFIVPGVHQRQNLSYAVAVAREFGISEIKIKKSVKKFEGVEGRLQLLRVYKGIKIYNDNNATTPESLIAGVKAVSPVSGAGEKKLVLICGGSDKKVDLTELVKTINRSCKFVSLIAGTGTDVLLENYKLKVPYEVSDNLKDVAQKALVKIKKGDVLLFSPAFASFGMFNNEYERNDLFVKIIKGLR